MDGMQTVAAALGRIERVAATEPVARVAAAFAAAGREVALVGGPVRDAFLGRPGVDLDFTTDAHPDEIVRIVAPIASTHWEIGRAFGTIGARVAGETVEITTYRTEQYDEGSRKPTVAFGEVLDEDLRRRDFTVNAIAVRLPGLVLADTTGGLDDLLAKRLRTPDDPMVSFSEDPLRMVRAARFTAQLGFALDDDARDAIVRLADRIDIVSPERVKDELVKLLLSPAPRRGLEVLVDTGLADRILPELPLLRRTSDAQHRHKDVYEHSLTVLDQAIALERERDSAPPSPDLVVRLAALLHDIGKPATRRFEEGGGVTFHHHDVVGAKLARKRLRALRFDNATIDGVAHLIALHQRFFGYADGEGGWTDSAVRRYVRDAEEELERLHILTRADVTTRNARKARRLADAYDHLERRIGELAEQQELDAARPDLDGERIMAVLDIPAGPDVGAAYRFLLELRLDEGPLGEEEAERRLRAWWASR